MDADQFLARVVPPGGYLALAYKKHDRGMRHRFFPRDTGMKDAAGYGRFMASVGNDVWFAVSSYAEAVQVVDKNTGKTFFDGARAQTNAQAIKCFFYDADIKRAGDGKEDGKAFANAAEVVQWISAFTAATGIPRPNMGVNSGYGLHLYWVLEDPVAPHVWLPYAEAFKAAMMQHGAKGDVGISSDCARLLRMPATSNFKVPENPVPVAVLDKMSATGDYPNKMIFDALQPWLGLVPAAALTTVGNALAGTPPSVMATHASTSVEAAQANMPSSRRPYMFKQIANHCLLAKHSLETNGATDDRQLWYLGMLSLLHFCDDGPEYVHEISKAGKNYDPAKTDERMQQIAAEQQRKSTGAPRCLSMHQWSQNKVCLGCPHWGKITTPYTLGREDGDLPDGYRRNNGRIERSAKKDDQIVWNRVIDGDVHSPVLDLIGQGRQLAFIYERAGRASYVEVMGSNVPIELKTSSALFEPMGVSINPATARPWGEFVMAWIEKLRDLNAERPEPIPTYGWVIDKKNEYQGFAVAGTVYRKGKEEPGPAGDPNIAKQYMPRGELAEWRRACELVIAGRTDLEVLVAGAFAAPLVEFTGQSGVTISAWSRDSAVGKSSALRVGTAVWADPNMAMCSLLDTINSIRYRIGKTKVMPAFWDEVQVKPGDEEDFVTTLFTLGQGRDKTRLTSASTLMDTGSWKTAVIMTGNRPLMDLVVQHRHDTDAGAVRLFEFQIQQPQMEFRSGAVEILDLVSRNYGLAGRIFAAWVVNNIETTKLLVNGFRDRLQRDLTPMTSERFYVAAMSTVLAGASIAAGCGLGNFQVQNMYPFLCNEFKRLRAARMQDLPVAGGVFAALGVFAEFFADMNGARLRTTMFGKPGRPSKDFRILWPPKTKDRIPLQIAEKEAIMRVDKNKFDGWCSQHRHSSSDIVAHMKSEWGATVDRRVIGAGTEYVTGRVLTIDIPLVTPELIELVDSDAGDAR